jgi:methyl-accepting chemotaxis protein
VNCPFPRSALVAAQISCLDRTRALQSADSVRAAVERVPLDVTGALESLRKVAQAAGEITRIALQTRLVAFNAAIEAKHAGEASSLGGNFKLMKDLSAPIVVSGGHWGGLRLAYAF